MSRTSTLFRLQEIDTELSAHRAQVQAIDHSLADSPEVRAAQRLVVEVEAELHTARVNLRGVEHDNQALGEKIADVEGRLYGGGVTNPKELQDLQQDLESLKRRNSELDERQLDALIRVESGEGRLAELQENLRRIELQTAKTNSHLVEEREQLRTRLSRLEEEREAALASVPPDDRETYERLRLSKNGRPVTRLEDGVCAACGVAPSASRLQNARLSDELVRCGNCDRILYAD